MWSSASSCFRSPNCRAPITRGTNLAGRYRDISELWDTRLDGLIVTGTEPRAANLKDEPYWPALTKLVDWARENTASTIWSCLAAHAAVLHADGIERQPLAEKLFGVFDCEVVAAHPLHGRHGAAAARAAFALQRASGGGAGSERLSRSHPLRGGRRRRVVPGKNEALRCFVFFQGHPEYEADTLLREYRRDVGRFLRGEREHYPAMPQGYFNDEAAALADAFRARATREIARDLIADFPMARSKPAFRNTLAPVGGRRFMRTGSII